MVFDEKISILLIIGTNIAAEGISTLLKNCNKNHVKICNMYGAKYKLRNYIKYYILQVFIIKITKNHNY